LTIRWGGVRFSEEKTFREVLKNRTSSKPAINVHYSFVCAGGVWGGMGAI